MNMKNYINFAFSHKEFTEILFSYEVPISDFPLLDQNQGTGLSVFINIKCVKTDFTLIYLLYILPLH